MFTGNIPLVKEGEDWKLDIPSISEWDVVLNVFNDRSKSYHTALDNFRLAMTNDRYDTAKAFEADVLGKLRVASSICRVRLAAPHVWPCERQAASGSCHHLFNSTHTNRF